MVHVCFATFFMSLYFSAIIHYCINWPPSLTVSSVVTACTFCMSFTTTVCSYVNNLPIGSHNQNTNSLGTHSALMKTVFSQFGWWDGNVESTAVSTDWKREGESWVHCNTQELKFVSTPTHVLMNTVYLLIHIRWS
jgi:hypothetical protein